MPPIENMDAIFPEFIEYFLPIKTEQLMDDPNLRKDGEWTKWPGRKESKSKCFNASEMESFINDIAEAAARATSTSVGLKHDRYWTSGFLDKLVTRAGEEVKTPDLVLLDKHTRLKDATWKDAISVMNVVHENGRERQPESDALNTKYAEHIFNVQPARRFVPICLVVEDELRITIFDRTGPLLYRHIPHIHKDPKNTLIAILGTLLLDRQDLGYDPTSYDKKESRIEGTFMKVGGVEYEVTTIYHEKIMHGRGTVCWKGISQVDGSVVVIKDQWTDVSKKNRELEILEHLNEGEESSVCTPDGVRVIPKVIASEIVIVKAPRVVEIRNEEEKGPVVTCKIQVVDVQDTTALLRYPDDDKRGVLAHWRMVIAPFASPIQEFSSFEGIVTIFRDVIYGKPSLVQVLHG